MLLKRAGLVSTLEGKGPYTVFAPTDTAFAKVPKATLARLTRNKAKLRSVLLGEGRLERLVARAAHEPRVAFGDCRPDLSADLR
jgi:hypothetical protein